MHKIYTAQREHPSLSIYSDFAIGAIIGVSYYRMSNAFLAHKALNPLLF